MTNVYIMAREWQPYFNAAILSLNDSPQIRNYLLSIGIKSTNFEASKQLQTQKI